MKHNPAEQNKLRGMGIYKAVGCFLSFAALAAWGADAQKGLDHYRANEFTEAVGQLESAASEGEASAEVQMAYGVSLLRSGKASESSSFLATAAEKHPDDAGLALALGEALSHERKFDEARALVAKAKGLNADHAWIPYVEGVILAGEKNYGPAAAQFEKACEKDPRNAYAHYYAGLSYNSLKRPDRMVSHFQSFIRLAPKAPEAARVMSILRTVR